MKSVTDDRKKNAETNISCVKMFIPNEIDIGVASKGGNVQTLIYYDITKILMFQIFRHLLVRERREGFSELV